MKRHRLCVPTAHFIITDVAAIASNSAVIDSNSRQERGLRFGYDPYAHERFEKYGAPGETDSEGFDPYADTVGPGIYGGRVKRDSTGKVVIGEQYQNHNPKPGPVYAGGGYAKFIEALKSPDGLCAIMSLYPYIYVRVYLSCSSVTFSRATRRQ